MLDCLNRFDSVTSNCIWVATAGLLHRTSSIASSAWLHHFHLPSSYSYNVHVPPVITV